MTTAQEQLAEAIRKYYIPKVTNSLIEAANNASPAVLAMIPALQYYKGRTPYDDSPESVSR